MVSGSLFLKPERGNDFRRILKNNVLHVFTALYFWSFVYADWNLFLKMNSGAAFSWTIAKEYIKSLLMGPTHLWFLFVLMGLYIITFLSKIAENKKMMEYFLLLWIVFGMIPGTLDPINGINFVGEIIRKLKMTVVTGYCGYFLLGYYVSVYFQPKKKQAVILTITGIAGFCFTCISTGLLSLNAGKYVETYLDPLRINCFVMAMAVFAGIRGMLEERKISYVFESAISGVAQNGLGVYLVHMLVFEVLQFCGVIGWLGNNVISLICAIIMTYLICYAISVGIQKIPVIGKWIV